MHNNGYNKYSAFILHFLHLDLHNNPEGGLSGCYYLHVTKIAPRNRRVRRGESMYCNNMKPMRLENKIGNECVYKEGCRKYLWFVFEAIPATHFIYFLVHYIKYIIFDSWWLKICLLTTGGLKFKGPERLSRQTAWMRARSGSVPVIKVHWGALRESRSRLEMLEFWEKLKSNLIYYRISIVFVTNFKSKHLPRHPPKNSWNGFDTYAAISQPWACDQKCLWIRHVWKSL